MVDLPVPRTDIVMRLKKAEGQLKGIQSMVEQERDCVDVMVQLAAVKAALESVAGLVLKNYTAICLAKKKGCDVGAELAKAVSIWVGGKA